MSKRVEKETDMGFVKDFEQVWKPGLDGITAALLREQKEKNEVSQEIAVKALMQAKRNFSDPLRVQYSFLVSMQDVAPKCGETFQKVLEQFQFAEVPMSPLPSKIPYKAATVMSAAVGGFGSFLLHEHFFLPSLIGRIPVVILGAVVFGGIGAGLFYSQWQARAEESRKDCAKLYLEQLQALHDDLLEVCGRADKA